MEINALQDQLKDLGARARLILWIGDDGFLHKSDCRIRRHNPDGDAMIISGEVTRKFEESGKKHVEVAQNATTHRCELSAFGTAVAELPSKC